MKIVCISDTHGLHRKISVPEGDLLIHAGDMSNVGKEDEIQEFNTWLGELPHRHKVVIAGNHDWLFQKNPELARSLITNAIYLEDSGVRIEGLDIWGSPWQPEFCNWAFNLPRGEALRAKWKLIPPETDILVTHGPPRGIGDQSVPHFNSEHLGCEDLAVAVDDLPLVQLHVFGHIHGGAGIHEGGPYNMKYINASVLNEAYRPNGKTFVIDL